MDLIIEQLMDTKVFDLSIWDYSIRDGVLSVYPKKRNGEKFWFPLQSIVYFKTEMREGED